MTIVEFFDTDDIENVVSTLLCAPERVVLVGDSRKRMERAISRYEQIAAKHDIPVTFLYRSIGRNDLQDIIRVLSGIVEEFGECTFDLVGGEDLYLVAVGTVFCTYRDKVQLHRFNLNNGKMYDCDADGTVLATKDTALTIEENICIYGGRVIFEEEKENTTYRWDFNDDFRADLDTMWGICIGDPGAWNTQVHSLDGYHALCVADKKALSVTIDKAVAEKMLPPRDYPAVFLGGFFKRLATYDLITNLSFSGDLISFTYKNEQVKRCLTNAGRVLELFVTVSAMDMTDADGNPLFDDVLNGVTIDWDGKVATTEREVDNEIDVVLMKDMVPTFISCKNGRNFTSDELYKLSTVAERFGGDYAKQVLITTRLDDMKAAGEAIATRAQAMGIRVLKVTDKMDSLHNELFCNEFKKLIVGGKQ